MKVLKAVLISMLLVLGACEDSPQRKGDQKVSQKVNRGEQKIKEFNTMTTDLNSLSRRDPKYMSDLELEDGISFCDSYINIGNEIMDIINDPDVRYFGNRYQIVINIGNAEKWKAVLQAEKEARPVRAAAEESRREKERAKKQHEIDTYIADLEGAASGLPQDISIDEVAELSTAILVTEVRKASAIKTLVSLLKSDKIKKYNLESRVIEFYEAQTEAFHGYKIMVAELAWRGEYVEIIEFRMGLQNAVSKHESDISKLGKFKAQFEKISQEIDLMPDSDHLDFIVDYSNLVQAYLNYSEQGKITINNLRGFANSGISFDVKFNIIDAIQRGLKKARDLMKDLPESRRLILEDMNSTDEAS